MPTDSQLTTLGQDTGGGQQLVRRGVFVISGVFYAAISRLETGPDLQVHIDSSADSGVNWTSISTITATELGFTAITEYTFAHDIYNGRLYGVFHGKTPITLAQKLVVAYFDTVALTWTFNPCPAISEVTPGHGGVLSGLDIVVNPSTSDLTIYFSWGFDGTNHTTQYIDYTSGVWGAQADIPGQVVSGGNPFQMEISQAIRAASGRVFIFMYDNNNTGLPASGTITGYCISREAGGSFNNFQTVATDIPIINNPYDNYSFGLGVSFSTSLIVPYLSGSQGVPSTGINNAVLNGIHFSDVANPTFTIKVIDNTITSGDPLLAPTYYPYSDVTSSVCVVTGTPVVYYFVSTSHHSTGAMLPASGDIRTSTYNGSSWGTPTVYRSFANPEVPAGVYALDASRAMYFKIQSLSTDQNTMMHFLGPGSPTLACPILNTGVVGVPYASPLVASGGTPPYTYAILVGPLPPGLSLNTSTGLISGTPTTPGVYPYEAQATDANNVTAQAECSITITGTAPTGGTSGTRGARRHITLTLWDFCLGRDFIDYLHIDPLALSCARKPECFLMDERAWDQDNGPPDGSIIFNPAGNIPLPAPIDGDVVIFSFIVPYGYDGIILAQYHNYTQPFIEGGVDLFWRVSSNGRWLRDLGNVPVTLGSPITLSPIAGGLQLFSGDLVKYIVAAPNTSGFLPAPGQGIILAGLHGYFFPRR